VIVPSLLSDRSSMVVLDIKMELYAMTADWRRRRFGHQVYAFAPTIDASWVAAYNPLADIEKGPQEVAYAQALALALVDPEGRTNTLNFWQASAQALLTAAILHVLYTRETPSLSAVQALLAAPGSGVRVQLERMRDTLHAAEHEAPWIDPETGNETASHPVVRLEAAKLLDMAEETRTSVLATARSYLTLFLDPVIAANTTRHDFSLRGLGAPGRPSTVYLILPARDIPRMRGFLRLFFQTLSFHLTGSLATEEHASGEVRPVAQTNRRLTLILDELAALGRLDLIGRQIAFLRGYGIQVVAAVQTANQLYEVYGERESVRGNLAYLLMFPSTEQKTAEEISKLLGDRTLYVETRGHTTGRTLLAPRRTRNVRDQRRALLTPDEVRRLPRGAVLLLVTGSQPVLCGMRPFDGWRRIFSKSQ
jgi:type IV secretion system protein VirD4